jgi:hypothetical protein
MRKNTLFISAALTAFILAVLVGVVSSYQTIVKPGAATQVQTSAPVVENISAPQVAAPAPSVVTPEQAAALASQVLGRSDLFSVETADFNGAQSYLVTFTSGDLVYVSPEGQILSIGKIAPTVTVNTVPSSRKKQNDGGAPVQTGGDDDGGEDHEDHDD